MANPAALALVAFAPLIVWRLRSRVRKLIGRQPYHPRGTWARVIIIPLVLALLAWAAPDHRLAALCIGGGALLGALLGVIGIRLTRFESTAEGHFYTPNTHLGLGLSAILFARIGYRFYQLATMPELPDLRHQSFAYSPSTLILVAMLLAYYCSYAAGLLRWQRRVKAQTPAPGADDN